jgi:hypothetical protein
MYYRLEETRRRRTLDHKTVGTVLSSAGRPGADVPKWEYMTWTTTDTKSGRSIRLVNGERLDEYLPEYPALAEAGEQGWELLTVVAGSGKQEHVLYFKRPLTES